MAPMETPEEQGNTGGPSSVKVEELGPEQKLKVPSKVLAAMAQSEKNSAANGHDSTVQDANEQGKENANEEENEKEEIAFLNFTQVERTRLLIPPLNFALVNKGVYRSGYPNQRNFSFLEELGIRTIVCLSSEENAKIKQENQDFIKRHMITQICVPIEGQKEPFTSTHEDDIREVLRHVLDERNHPLLVHCDKGKHRTGCVIACLRKLEGWSLASIFREYELFSKKSARWMDLQLIELFTMPMIQVDVEQLPRFLQLN